MEQEKQDQSCVQIGFSSNPGSEDEKVCPDGIFGTR